MAQLERYDDLPKDIRGLAEFTALNRNVDFAGRFVYDANGCEVFNFGKHKGKRVEDVLRYEPSYYDWMINGDFSRDTKRVLTSIRVRMSGNMMYRQ